MPFDFLDFHRDWSMELAERIAYWRGHLLRDPLALATIDFETRSACDLKKHGSWVYSKHPTTEAMCLAFHLPGYEDVDLWHAGYEDELIAETELPLDLFAYILAGGAVEAHNAFFERVIWLNVMVARHGWPKVPSRSWRCSASRASACALPRDLENAGKAMGLGTEKDMDGRKLMLKMSKPRQPRKAEIEEFMEANGLTGDYRRHKQACIAGSPIFWHFTEEDFYRLCLYCKQDVRTEMELSDALPDLSDTELQVWFLDQEINERGARFDRDMATVALDLAEQWKKKLNKELHEITGVERATQRAQVKAWLEECEDLELPDTTAETMDWYLDNVEMSGRARRVLYIMKQVNRTSTRKYQAALDKTDPDDWRARDLLMYHGANTGRWSGKGIQVQNLPRGKMGSNASYFNKKGELVLYFDMDVAVEDILEGDIDWLEICYGDVMELLSSALRGMIMPREGYDLIVADYSAIEARCVLWEAGAEDALQVFRTGGDIYCDMATGIYGYNVNKKDHPDERQFGKQAILGLGYQMGFITFLLTCRKYKISFGLDQVKRILGTKFNKYHGWVDNYLFPKPKDGEAQKAYNNRKRQATKVRRQLTDAGEKPAEIIHELALMKYTVDVYRTRYSEVKAMWNAQEAAALSAVRQWEDLLWSEIGFMDEGYQELYAPRGRVHMAEDLKTPVGIKWRDGIDGPRIKCGPVTWFVMGGFLCCELPSGRLLRYRDPMIKASKTSWGETKDALRYWTVVTGGKWARTSTYGGKLVENITQAIARDVMAEAMLRSAETIYDALMTVHDELVCEVPSGQGDVKEFEQLMAETAAWADGCPIDAEGGIMKRYRK